MENKYHIRRPGYRKHLISAGLDMEKNLISTGLDMEKISYLQAWIWRKSHIHRPGYGKNLISAGLGIENISYPRAWIWKKSHIRRPGYGKKSPCASMWGACFYLGRVCFNVGCLLLSRVHRFASNWLIG